MRNKRELADFRVDQEIPAGGAPPAGNGAGIFVQGRRSQGLRRKLEAVVQHADPVLLGYVYGPTARLIQSGTGIISYTLAKWSAIGGIIVMMAAGAHAIDQGRYWCSTWFLIGLFGAFTPVRAFRANEARHRGETPNERDLRASFSNTPNTRVLTAFGTVFMLLSTLFEYGSTHKGITSYDLAWNLLTIFGMNSLYFGACRPDQYRTHLPVETR